MECKYFSIMDSCSMSDDDEYYENQQENEVAEMDPSGRFRRYTNILVDQTNKIMYCGFDNLEGIEISWTQVKLGEDILEQSQALKVLNKRLNLIENLEHNYIVRCYGSWIDVKERNLNIITEILQAGTLSEYIKKHKKVSTRAIKKWAKQILEGLHYLHSHDPPIIHGNLSLDSIYVDGDKGEVKIGDLGIADMLGQDPNSFPLKRTLDLTTSKYQCEERNEMLDMYSFGVCLSELLAFEDPSNEEHISGKLCNKISLGIKSAVAKNVKNSKLFKLVERCFDASSSRPTAKDLLLDPVLQLEELSSDDGLRANLSNQKDVIISEVYTKLGLKPSLARECSTSERNYSIRQIDQFLSSQEENVSQMGPNENNGNNWETLCDESSTSHTSGIKCQFSHTGLLILAIRSSKKLLAYVRKILDHSSSYKKTIMRRHKKSHLWFQRWKSSKGCKATFKGERRQASKKITDIYHYPNQDFTYFVVFDFMYFTF